VCIAVQLYTLRRLDATLPELLHVVAGSGFDGVEFAGLGDADPVDLLDGLGDRIRLVHGKDVDVGSGAPVDLGEGDVDGCGPPAGSAQTGSASSTTYPTSPSRPWRPPRSASARYTEPPVRGGFGSAVLSPDDGDQRGGQYDRASVDAASRATARPDSEER